MTPRHIQYPDGSASTYFGSDQNSNENDISFGELNSNLIQHMNVARPEVQPPASTSSGKRTNSRSRQRLGNPNNIVCDEPDELNNQLQRVQEQMQALKKHLDDLGKITSQIFNREQLLAGAVLGMGFHQCILYIRILVT